MNNLESIYSSCTLCPRECRANRNIKTGYCKTGSGLLVSRAALHFWEEPCISGENGSGTVFFGGCSLGCIYCQNSEIRDGNSGKIISADRLAEIFAELQDKGANNINLVTPTHYIPHIVCAIKTARKNGLNIPIVYNTGGYEKIESLKLLDGLVDIYLPDFKYITSEIAREYSNAPDYPQIARNAIREMVRQVGKPVFNNNRIMQKGVIVRHLLLPGQLENSRKAVKYLHDTYKDTVFISLMSQYTPMAHMKNHPVLSRKVSGLEYNALVDYAIDIGVENGFIQEGESASESFIPPFDNTGVDKL